jgi:hypothetical protein
VNGNDILEAAEACRAVLEPALALDWSAPIPGLDFTVAGVVAHASNAPLWYSVDMWSGPADGTFEVSSHADRENERLLTSLLAASQVLAAAVDAAPPDLRGFHPFGSPDPAGFAAMACDELLVHGRDAALGLGREFSGDKRLARAVLTRLFPWHESEPDEDPWLVLLWANGRLSLPGRGEQTRWRWHCAPLSEWDGSPP